MAEGFDGTATNNITTDQHTLIKCFDLGVNVDGYYNFNHVVPQNKDNFHFLTYNKIKKD